MGEYFNNTEHYPDSKIKISLNKLKWKYNWNFIQLN